MPRTRQVLRVLISSPSDVAEERRLAEYTIRSVGRSLGPDGPTFEVVRAEDLTPGIGPDPQQVINEQVLDYDVFVGIMWTRIGSPTARARSGTIEEFENAVARWREHQASMAIMFFFSTRSPESDPGQLEDVREFKNSLGAAGVFYQQYSEPGEFVAKLHTALFDFAKRLSTGAAKQTSMSDPVVSEVLYAAAARRAAHSRMALPPVQTATVVKGCIVATVGGGRAVQISTSGRDSNPVISPDKKQIAFLRGASGFAAGDEAPFGWFGSEPNEIWIADSDARNVECLVRSATSGDMRKARGGLHNLQFSPDGEKLFFLSYAWVTSHAVHRVDLVTGQVRFVCDARTLEVISSGEFAGHLIVSQHKYFLGGGSYDWYWLVHPDGEVVACIGPELTAFRAMHSD